MPCCVGRLPYALAPINGLLSSSVTCDLAVCVILRGLAPVAEPPFCYDEPGYRHSTALASAGLGGYGSRIWYCGSDGFCPLGRSGIIGYFLHAFGSFFIGTNLSSGVFARLGLVGRPHARALEDVEFLAALAMDASADGRAD